MAGSSGNWYKAGGSTKGNLYVSSAVMKKHAPDYAALLGMSPDDIAGIKKVFQEEAIDLRDILVSLSKKSDLPKGMALKAIPPPTPGAAAAPPPEWASDPVAKALIEAQATKNVRKFDPEFVAAYRAANPEIPVYGRTAVKGEPPAAKSLRSYQGMGYGRRNRALWSVERSVDGVMAGVSASDRKMQALVLSSKAPIDMTVTRAAGAAHPLYKWAQNIQVGDAFASKGFDSTSLNPLIRDAYRDVTINMRIPKGSRGIAMNAVLENASYSGEQEWLLPANTTWAVVGRETEGVVKLKVTLELVEQRDFDGNVIWP